MTLALAPALFSTMRRQLADSLHTTIPDPTPSEQLVQTNQHLFKVLDEGTDRPAEGNFWWDFYAAYFIQMEKDGHTQVASYYIASSGGEKDALKWLVAHEDDLNAYSKWFDAYWEQRK